MPTLTVREKLSAARLMARNRMPYFGAALMKLAPLESPGIKTMAVTKHAVLMYDPDAVNKWSVEETATALLHEVSHLIRNHCGRCERRKADHTRWNIAADAEINDDLVNAGYKFPDIDIVLPKKLKMDDGLLAEAYYNGPWNPPPSNGKGEGTPQVGKGWCGSGGGKPVPGEPEDGNEINRSSAELEGMRRQVAQAIQEANAKGRGNVPQGWQRWADAFVKPPKIRWQDKLARAARRAVAYRPGAEDYRRDRPARRQAVYGYGPGVPILARTVRPIPRVAIVVDTSGSMGREDLTVALREARGAMTAIGAQVDFCTCDASVHSFKAVDRWETLPSLLKGGGGTDFRPAFEAITRARVKPEVVIFITDGDGPAPAVSPLGIKTVWLLVGKHVVTPCAWGDIVKVED